MQVFGLPGQIIRNGRAASRLLAAKTPDIEAARRRDAVARWRRAMADGLTAAQAARAVGAPRSNLYRWETAPEPKSRRPKRLRQPQWPPALAEAVQTLRLDNPMWGKRKIAALLRRNGFAASASTVGRILKRLMQRGRIVPVPILRKRPEKRRFRLRQRQRYAQRLAKGRKARSPGELVQIDTLFVNLRPDKAIKHFTAYDPIAKWTLGHVSTEASANAAKALLAKLLAAAPFPVKGHPGRRRIGVHGRLRRPLPPQRPRTRRPAAQTARSQRRRRARPVQLAIRVLRLIRPAKPHR
jgi:hypothetical protein